MNMRIKCLMARPMASMSLLCIPFAGGGAGAFRTWAPRLPAFVELYAVQLPGREDSLNAAPLLEWRPMQIALIGEFARLPPRPTAIFGHSLGAVMALELARWMHAAQPGRLRHLFVAGRPWPGQSTDERSDLLALDDDAFLDALDRQYGSLSSSLAHPEIRELALPTLRADIRLLDSFRYETAQPLDCPLTVYGGTADPATDAENLDAWRCETTGPFRVRMFGGAHFFLETQRDELIADIAASLQGSVR
jgi:surfactin synthase thioesterase subunit